MIAALPDDPSGVGPHNLPGAEVDSRLVGSVLVKFSKNIRGVRSRHQSVRGGQDGVGSGRHYIAAWYPGGPRSRGPRGVSGAEDSDDTAETAEVGVNVESTGLAWWAYDAGALIDDEVNEEEEPARPEAIVEVSPRPCLNPGLSRRAGCTNTKREALRVVLGSRTGNVGTGWQTSGTGGI